MIRWGPADVFCEDGRRCLEESTRCESAVLDLHMLDEPQWHFCQQLHLALHRHSMIDRKQLDQQMVPQDAQNSTAPIMGGSVGSGAIPSWCLVSVPSAPYAKPRLKNIVLDPLSPYLTLFKMTPFWHNVLVVVIYSWTSVRGPRQMLPEI